MNVILVASIAASTSSLRGEGGDDANPDQASETPARQPAAKADQSTPRERVNQGFEQSSPSIGELIPDVAGFDASGKEVRLRNLRGRHTVLVFGCLT
jgi:hypothetical protein